MQPQTFSPRPGVTIGYHQFKGTSPLPGVIFFGGFMSDMTGAKATYLEETCKARGQSYVRFDYTGRPASSGNFAEGAFGDWVQDAFDVLDQLTTGPQILVGSSMGGWMSLLLGVKRPERVAGIILLAAAPDFLEEVYRDEFNDAQRREVEEKDIVYIPSDYGAPYPFAKRLFDEGRRHMLMDKKININCPVRLIHGKEDKDVPWQKSQKIKSLLTSTDVDIIWVDDGDHRLSRDQDLVLLNKTVEELNRVTGK